MGEKLLLIVAGVVIGIIGTLIILREDIFKVIDYHDGLPDLEDIDHEKTVKKNSLAE